jgi:SepF-like predicted cell division protein (DUF552 family)
MKELIEDYKRRIKTIENELKYFQSTGSINDIKKVERLTTKLFEYRVFIADLERLNVQPDTFEDAIPDIGEQINTVGALKAFLSTLKDDDLTILEAIDLQTGDVQDLYPFHMDVIDGIELTDGRTVSEIRFCQETNITEELKAMYAKDNVHSSKLISFFDFSMLRTQKRSLINIIDDFEKTGKKPDELILDLCGILNLIDAIQDYAVDVVGMNPVNVFDFDFEEARKDIEPVIGIIARKKQGIDCTEEESAEIKGYLRELKLPEEQAIVADIQQFFTQEYNEYLSEEDK